jgi:hypothetical protein
MKKLPLASLVVFLLGVVGLLRLPTVAMAATHHATHNKVDSYIVVQINDESKSEYKVVSSSQMKSEKKRIADEYKGRVKAWNDDRKTDPTIPKPVQATLKIMKDGFETQEGADRYKKKLEDDDAGNGDKTDKDKDKDKDK